MFTARTHIRPSARPAALALAGRVDADPESLPGRILRFGAFCAMLALGAPASASAQASSTMQVSARVLPAAAAWTGLTEAGMAARQAAGLPHGQALVRSAGVVQTRAQVLRADDRSLLVVTVQHPRN